MTPRPSGTIADELLVRQRSIGNYIRRVERSVAPGYLATSDLKHAYAGAVLAYADLLENCLERLFIGLLVGSLTPSRAITTRIDVRSHAVARELIIGDRKYIDWLPYSQTLSRAKLFFRSGEPFTRLSGTEKLPFERLRIVRNALAHRSEHARFLFERQLLSSGLPAWQRQPSGWLRGSHAGTQTRFENLLATVGQSMRSLCA